MYFVPSQKLPCAFPELRVPITKAVMVYKAVTSREMIMTSIILLIINWFRLHPSIMFWRWVLNVYSLVMNMMTTMEGRKTNKDEMKATVCQAPGKVKGLGN